MFCTACICIIFKYDIIRKAFIFYSSSCMESPTHWNVASPNLIVSPESLNIIQDVVFEPRPNEKPCQTTHNSHTSQHRPPQRNYSVIKKKTVRINPEPIKPLGMFSNNMSNLQFSSIFYRKRSPLKAYDFFYSSGSYGVVLLCS